MDKKALILSLIQDDLRSFRLINSLSAIGLNADDHHLGLGMTVFQLMDIEVPVSDTSYDSYVMLAGLAQHVPLEDRERKLASLAMDVYNYLNHLPKKSTEKKSKP